MSSPFHKDLQPEDEDTAAPLPVAAVTLAQIMAGLSTERLIERATRWQDGAAANSDNCRGARDEWGDEDGHRAERVEFWGDLAAASYADCREMLDEILRRNAEKSTGTAS